MDSIYGHLLAGHGRACSPAGAISSASIPQSCTRTPRDAHRAAHTLPGMDSIYGHLLAGHGRACSPAGAISSASIPQSCTLLSGLIYFLCFCFSHLDSIYGHLLAGHGRACSPAGAISSASIPQSCTLLSGLIYFLCFCFSHQKKAPLKERPRNPIPGWLYQVPLKEATFAPLCCRSKIVQLLHFDSHTIFSFPLDSTHLFGGENPEEKKIQGSLHGRKSTRWRNR